MKTFSSGEVAKICDVTSRTVIRWIGAGKLNAFKLPGRGNNRVSEHDLIHFLHQNNMPIPLDIAPVQENTCVIVTEDDYLLKHVKRMVRDANFNIASFSSGIEAGFEIALTKPQLIVLDADIESAKPKHIQQHTEKLFDYRPHFIIFDSSLAKLGRSDKNTSVLSKPLALNEFADTLENALLKLV
jgi:PleD family two-component response regulator